MIKIVCTAVLLATVGACEADVEPIAVAPRGCAGFEDRGPYAAGVITLEMAGVPVEVWYPAEPSAVAGLARSSYDIRSWLPASERDKIPADESPLFEMDAYREVPAHGGPFPMVLFSHGMGGYRNQSSFLMTHLASWGFVVASADHTERGLATLVETGVPRGDDAPATLRAMLGRLADEHTRAAGPLAGRLDLSRVAVSGHSAGGGAVLEVAADPGFSAWVTFASGGFGNGGGPAVPSLMMAGTHDDISVASQIESAFARQTADKRYLAIDRMGHLGFTDLCAIGADRGGILQIAADYGIFVPPILMVLGRDGCDDGDLEPEKGWQIINHYTTAHLHYALGGAAPIGLSDDSVGCFDENVASYQHD